MRMVSISYQRFDTECDTCLCILRGGLISRYNKVEWLSEYYYHLATAHGIHQGDQAVAHTIQEQLGEFWRTFSLPEKSQTAEH